MSTRQIETGRDSSDNVETRLEQIEHEYQQLRQLIDIAPIYFYATDWDMRYQYANLATAQGMGLEHPDLLQGLRYQDLDPQGDQAEMLLTMARDTMQSGLPKLTEDVAFVRPADGQEQTLNLFEVPYRDPTTGEPRLLGIGVDVTHARKLEQERLRNQKIEAELDTARRIQEALWPSSPADCPAYDIAGWSQPAEHAGGDYYDWFSLGDNYNMMFALGDVTGHGIGSAMVASATRAYGRAILDRSASLTERMTALNQLVSEDQTDHFVTLVAVDLSRKTRSAQMVSAGHGPILFFRKEDDRVIEFATHGLPLGIDPQAEYDEPTSLLFEDGDILLLTSDGFFERSNANGKQFGIPQLIESFRRHADKPAQQIIQAIRQDVDQFADHTPAHDDMTAVVIKFRAVPKPARPAEP